MLLHAQGETLDKVERGLDGAQDYLEDAEVQLKGAQTAHEYGKKQLCCGLACIGCMTCVLFTIIFGAFS